MNAGLKRTGTRSKNKKEERNKKRVIKKEAKENKKEKGMNENTYFSPFALFFLRNLVNAQNLAYIT